MERSKKMKKKMVMKRVKEMEKKAKRMMKMKLAKAIIISKRKTSCPQHLSTLNSSITHSREDQRLRKLKLS